MTVEVDLSPGWRLRADSSEPEARLAAQELSTALGTPGADGVEIALSHSGGPGDGFSRRTAPGRIELEGESARGLLFGTYATLEELGAAWSWPGEDRGAATGARLDEQTESAPALPGRCLVLGERALVEDAESWIAWAARNRLNSVFVHASLSPRPLGAAPEDAWRQRRERAVAMARRRGMAIEHGGHLLPELLPREEVRALAVGGGLSDGGRRTVREHVLDHPEADVLHLWGADLPPGARGRDASEAALRTANALAEVAGEARPGALVAFLAYHDTEEVPRGVQPRDNVCLLFAPRERCYEHALADPGCTENARYRELLEAQLEHFGAAAPARVFEYWFDAILFAGGVPDLRGTIAEDLAFYRDAGVHTVQMLCTGHGRRPSPHPNPLAFARLAWDPSAPVAA
jgi:Domain of unknown function (DUF4838)